MLLSGRSRARRKEYLQELETKLRSFEQVGIEASSEIQSAARKVVDENRTLRSLLHKRGVSEAEIVMALGGPSDRSYDLISAVPSLSAMLDRRINCNTLSSTSSPSVSHMRASSMPRHMPSVPPISIPASRPTALSTCDSPSPGSITSSMETPPPISYSAPFYAAPVTPPAPEIKTEDVQYGYAYDQPYPNNWHYSSDYNMIGGPANYYNNTSCIDAANIIRTMRSEPGHQVEPDLSRRMPPHNCYIDNNMVLNMMEHKYPHQQPLV
jgi:hypothetical protein